MSITKHRSTSYHPLWGCLVCHNRYVQGSEAQCPICHAPRPQDRFAINLEGRYMLCHVETVNLRCVAHVYTVHPTKLAHDSFKIPLKDKDGLTDKECTIQESLVESILEYWDARKQKSPTKVRDKQSKSTPKSCLESPIANVFDSLFNGEVSLFDRVMRDANETAYDARIGQYISKGTLSPNKGETKEGFDGSGSSPPSGSKLAGCTTCGDEDGDTGTGMNVSSSSVMATAARSAEQTIPGVPKTRQHESIKTELSYVQSMQRERTVMKQTVQELVNRRQKAFLYDSSADLDLQQSERDRRVQCPSCERLYPVSQLLGCTSFRAVAKWRAEHNAPILPSDHRLDAGRINDAVRLCIFCTQFFDGSSAADLVDARAMLRDPAVGMGDLVLDGPLNVTNAVYKKMFRTMATQARQLEAARPLSGLRNKLAVEHLKLKAKQQQDMATGGMRFIFNSKVKSSGLIDVDGASAGEGPVSGAGAGVAVGFQQGGMIDQLKTGRFLRDKYADGAVSALL